MSRKARTISESGVYHILFRGVNQQNIFEESSDFEKIKETIATVKQDLHFEIYAYCFMSNHVHHFHQTRIRDGTLLDYMVQYRKPLSPQFSFT